MNVYDTIELIGNVFLIKRIQFSCGSIYTFILVFIVIIMYIFCNSNYFHRQNLDNIVLIHD